MTLRPARITGPGLLLVVILAIAALLSMNGQMPLGKQSSTVTRDFLIGDGSALEPSFLVIGLYGLALVLNMVPSRLAIVGTLGLLAAGLINTAGVLPEPVSFRVLALGFGPLPATVLTLQVLTAAAVVVLAIWELAIRTLDRGNLPATAT
jgi:hypothetical protein